MHIKVINGKKYYYESKRIGNKVITKYIGPVDRIRKRKEPEEDIFEELNDDNFYVG